MKLTLQLPEKLNKVHFVIVPAHEHLAYVPPTRTSVLWPSVTY